MKARIAAVVGAVVLLGGCGRPAPDEQAVSAPPVQEAASPAPATTPAPAQAPTPAQAPSGKGDPVRTYKVAVAYSAKGDLLGDGRPLMAEVLAEEPHPFGYWPETITLQVREPGGTVLGTAELQTTRPTGLDLVDMAQNGKPYIVVRSRTLAVSDHMAHLHVYRLDAQGLHLEGTFDGWLGSSSVGTREGRAVARIRYRYQHEWNDYLPIELITNPAPRLLRTLTIGWQDGHVGVVADEFTRLAYPLYGNTEIERPLRPEAVALWQKGEALL
ncbi:MAG TPA: hypothetical protein VK464_23185, partial [Symbiobacteriaceae bacterium]|nr:hypothetical protein [Symbiobacteriaceae bacterium]